MKDLMKGFIQGAKHKFDTEEPRDDFFNEILQKMDEKNSPKVKRTKWYRPFWISIAASLSLILIFIFLLPKIESGKEIMSNRSNEHRNTTKAVLPEPKVNSDNTDDIPDMDHTAHNSVNLNKQSKTVDDQNNFTHISSAQFKGSKAKDSHLITDSLNSELDIANKTELGNLPGQSIVAHPPAAETKDIAADYTQEKTNSSSVTESVQSIHQNANEEVVISSPGVPTDLQQSNADEAIEEEQSLGSYVKKSLIQIIKQRAKKIAGDVIELKQHQEEDQKVLALKFKSPNLEFTRTIPWGDSRD